MGAIQDSLNSMITTAAIGAGGAKHIAEEHTANVIKTAEMKSSIADIEEDINGLRESQEVLSTENSALGGPQEEYELGVEEAKGGEDLAKAKEAMTALTNKIAAKTAQKEALERTMANLGKTPMQILREGSVRQIKALGKRIKNTFVSGGKR